MYMGVMGLIMECGIPFEVPAVYLIILTQKFHPAPKQCLPLCGTVIPKPFGILSPQADDIGPYHSRMICHLLCHTGQYNRLSLIRKQTMSTDFFYSWSVCKIIYVIFSLAIISRLFSNACVINSVAFSLVCLWR